MYQICVAIFFSAETQIDKSIDTIFIVEKQKEIKDERC